MKNNVKKLREALLMSKAELARRAGVSTLTVDRVEKGKDCRMETKRKIIIALGLTLAEKDFVFGDKKPDRNVINRAAERVSLFDVEAKEEKDSEDGSESEQ